MKKLYNSGYKSEHTFNLFKGAQEIILILEKQKPIEIEGFYKL